MPNLPRLVWTVALLGLLALTGCGTTGASGGMPSPSPDASGPGPGTPPVAPPGGGANPPQAGTLTAGDVDDNLNFAAFQTYLSRMQQADQTQELPAAALGDRVSVRVLDASSAPVPNARVRVFAGAAASPFFEGWAGAGGVFQFFPAFDGAGGAQQFRLEFSPPAAASPTASVSLDLAQPPAGRGLEVRLEGFSAAAPQALDLMLVMDATGSMGDEMGYLKAELKEIINGVKSRFPAVSSRFALIVYRDLGDEYVVRAFDFTDSADTIQGQLAQQAGGGGDYPEAMEQALERANQAQWRGGNTARLLFLVADAPPHRQHMAAGLNQAKAARRQGLRIYPVAASGVADQAEYLMRLAAAATHSRHLFLTDDSGVGNPHQEPKIPCFVVTRLDQLLIRVISSELTGARVEPAQDQIIRRVGNPQNGVCQATQ